MQYAAALAGIFACPADVNVLPTSEFWSKLVETYVKKNKPDLCLTISTSKSFYHFTGRLVASYIYAESGLHCHFNALGANIWLHQWGFEKENADFIFRCFHGIKMVPKPITYHFSPTSDEGTRAILTGEGKTERGKNQKEVVKLTNFNNIVCSADKDCQFPTIHMPTSCGMNFGNKDKAKAAFLHNINWTCAMFPKAKRLDIENKMIIVTKCFCNYGHENIQIGRQMCKMTAYEIPGANDLEEDSCIDDMMKATAKYKQTFIFQCCNPMTIKSKTNNKADINAGKHCDFKLSIIDVRNAMKTSKDIWNKLRETLPDQNIPPPKLQLPLFSFDPKKHCFKNAIVVRHDVEEEEEDAFC